LKQQGYSIDPGLLYKDKYETISFEDIRKFYLDNIQDKPMVIAIVGNKKTDQFKGIGKIRKTHLHERKEFIQKLGL